MIFDQNLLAELLELQRKAADLTKSKTSVDEVQDLVMTLLNKWGISDLPWVGDFKSRYSFQTKGNTESTNSRHFNIDISEKKQHIQVQVLLPGIKDQSDLSIKLLGNTLYITENNSNRDDNDGPFNRKIRLPAEVTSAGATAIYRDNHLTITLPKIAADGEFIPLDFS